jgi:hypothetical protein
VGIPRIATGGSSSQPVRVFQEPCHPQCERQGNLPHDVAERKYRFKVDRCQQALVCSTLLHHGRECFFFDLKRVLIRYPQ